jgi:hypothetical protein
MPKRAAPGVMLFEELSEQAKCRRERGDRREDRLERERLFERM